MSDITPKGIVAITPEMIRKAAREITRHFQFKEFGKADVRRFGQSYFGTQRRSKLSCARRQPHV